MRIAATLLVLIGAICIAIAILAEIGTDVDLVHTLGLGKPGRFYLVDIPLLTRIVNLVTVVSIGVIILGLLMLRWERNRAQVAILLGGLALLWTLYAGIGLGGV